MAQRRPPVIGITCQHEAGDHGDRWYVNAPYIRAVAAAGGVPVLIPPAWDPELLGAALERVDGLVLTGGVDVDPARYGQEPHPQLGRVDPEWDDLDVTVARLALARDVPVLGICRGMQVLNVAAGGTLYQDIPSQVPGALAHQQSAPREEASHGVAVQDGSRLHGVLAAAHLAVNSFHHQAVLAVAPGFQATAHAPDGIIEGIEGVAHRFALGVQWHPEHLTGRDPAHFRLFAALVAAAGQPVRALPP
ncbi:MAG: gamma-glutamyl-gamma-aminobutyrate hydrolase family protein [Limnochordales bacterium]|nr:gamma-glutamyl-gamma-aminobutyrate hydrolase family protein [Limnochordales bacterium]